MPSGIRAHGPGFLAGEDSARLRTLGYQDRHCNGLTNRYIKRQSIVAYNIVYGI
jgi:hypothetical protein